MNNIAEVFQRGKAFIPFVTAGDPTLEVTERLLPAMAEAGADLIEVGIPFSDPVAEGPVIQQADIRALAAGTTTDKIFEMLERAAPRCKAALAIMTYINPVFTYGIGRFLARCAKAGVAAIIVPDVPFEEKEELSPYCKQYGVELISMIAPTSHDRIRRIAAEAEGFLYCVSSMGVTGVRRELGDQAAEMVAAVRQVSKIPCAVGFGISTPEQAKRMAAFADGVIVGSAIVKLAEQYGRDCVEPIVDYVRQMKGALCG